MKKKMYEPSIVAIGGGTGLSTMLRGLKKYSKNITAIVTMADDGGSSGMLRAELGMPPPGDVRNCLQALANTEPIMSQILDYRFSEGGLKGQNLGNLMLAALTDISGSFNDAVRQLSEVLAITGRVLPVTAEDVRLSALFDDGSEVLGESKIGCYKKKRRPPNKPREAFAGNPTGAGGKPPGNRGGGPCSFGAGQPLYQHHSQSPNCRHSGRNSQLQGSEAIHTQCLNGGQRNRELYGFGPYSSAFHPLQMQAFRVLSGKQRAVSGGSISQAQGKGGSAGPYRQGQVGRARYKAHPPSHAQL